MILSYTVPESGEGRKVYSVLRREFDASAALVRRLKQCGGVYVDGVPVYTIRKLSPGETVTADISAAVIILESSCSMEFRRVALASIDMMITSTGIIPQVHSTHRPWGLSPWSNTNPPKC